MAKRSSSGRRRATSRGEATSQGRISPAGAGEQSEQTPLTATPATRELPAVELTPSESVESAPTSAPVPEAGASREAWMLDADDAVEEIDEEIDEGATREAPAVTGPQASLASADPDATVVRGVPHAPAELATVADEMIPAQETPAPRPRYNTLAGAFTRPRTTPSPADAEERSLPPAAPLLEDMPTFEMAGIADEVDPELEWSVADQPTIHLSPEELRALRPSSFLDTGGQPSWPPRPQAAPPAPDVDASAPPPAQPRSAPPYVARADEPDVRDWRSALPPRPQPPFPLEAISRPFTQSERLAAPDGRVAPLAEPDGAMADYRMERFQELRRHRMAHEQGDAATDDVTPVAEAVRQWWNDLRPGVGSALRFQREARASGTHPLPAYVPPPPTSRLGDAFGRLAASAREMTGRAQQAAGPTLKRIHDQVEQAAQGIIQRFEGDAARQQAPLLGPGRVAIFFRQGVTVGQAQRLLAASSARPMRLISRRHGILAHVMPGRESEVCERLRQHPYVDDVVYMEYDERGEPPPSGR